MAAVLAAGMIPTAPTHLRASTAVTGGVAVVLTTAAAFGWRRALAWALIGFVVEYAVALADRPAVDIRAPLVAAGLLLVGEFASLAMNLARPTPTGRPMIAQVVEAVGLGLGTVVLGTLVIAVAAVQPRAGLLVQAASAAAAVCILVLITRLAKGRTEVRS